MFHSTPRRVTRATLEQRVVRHRHGRAAVYLKDRMHVLQKVELLVQGAGPEIVAIVGQQFAALRSSSEGRAENGASDNR